MELNKYIIYIILAVAIILAVVLKDRIKASFMGLKLDTENRTRKNHTKIKGDNNKVKQGSNSKNPSVNSNTLIEGIDNDVEQN